MAATITPIAAAHAMARTAARADGWSNLSTGLGDALRDKRMKSSFFTTTLGSDQAEELYRGDDLAARIADLLPEDMTRQGWDVVIEGEKETMEAIAAAQKQLGVVEKFRLAETWARVFGGAILLMGKLDGSEDLSLPLDEKNLEEVGYLNVFDAREAIGIAWYGDPQEPRFGEVAMYRIQPLTLNVTTNVELQLRAQEKKGKYNGLNLATMGLSSDPTLMSIRYAHESRVLRFEGTKLSRRLERTQFGWGDSIYTRLVEEIRDFQGGFDSTAVLLQDFAQGVFKMDGLAEAISSGQQSLLLARLQAMDLARSVVRATVVDKEGEEFERKATPVAGLAELLDRFMFRLSAATGYPVTLLFGRSPAGMNATGESDIRLYYDKVGAAQQRKFLPPLERVVGLIFRSKKGPTAGKEPKNWTIRFRPLWQMDELEQAQVRKTQADADHIYMLDGAVTPEEIASSRFGGDEYSTETQLIETDPDKRALAAAEAQAAAVEVPDPAKEQKSAGAAEGGGTGRGERKQ